MPMRISRILAISVLAVCSVAAQAAGYREPRELVYNGTPVVIHVAKDVRTEVVFPERVPGGLPPVRANLKPDEVATEGMEWSRGPNLDRISFLPHVANYQGSITLHGASGQTYILYLRADPNPDVLVTLQNGKVKQEIQEEQAKKTPRHKLIEYLMLGKVPPGYRRDVYSGDIEKRIVYRQGAVVLYLQEAYSSPRFTGLVLIAENAGRTPVFFPLESLDYSSLDLRKALGNVIETSIDNPYLGPHPEYARDAMNAPHQSYIYVTLRKEAGNGR